MGYLEKDSLLSHLLGTLPAPHPSFFPDSRTSFHRDSSIFKTGERVSGTFTLWLQLSYFPLLKVEKRPIQPFFVIIKSDIF
jgi:hypothetical protein